MVNYSNKEKSFDEKLDLQGKIHLKKGAKQPRQTLIERAAIKGFLHNSQSRSINKGHLKDLYSFNNLQNSIVKVSYTKNLHKKFWKSHGCYLQREAAVMEAKQGLGFDEKNDGVDIAQKLENWEKNGDPLFFRLIISPENAHKMDLKQHIRELMIKVERDLGVKVEYAGILHGNTDNIHGHVVLRGVSLDGKPLRINKNYIKDGVRQRSKEVATKDLGVRLRSDVMERRQRAIEQSRFTELDREIIKRCNYQNCITFEDSLPKNQHDMEFRLQLIGRLQFLEAMELTKKVGHITWEVSADLEKALRTFQINQDIVKRHSKHLFKISDPNLPLEYARLKEGEEIAGRVVGFGIHNENTNSKYILIEGLSGKVVYLNPNVKIVDDRNDFKLRNGDIIKIEIKSFYKDQKKVTYMAFENWGGLKSLKEAVGVTKADEYVLKKLMRDEKILDSKYPPNTFREQFFTMMKERLVKINKQEIDKQGWKIKGQ